MGAYKMQRMASSLSFLEPHHKYVDEFLNHILRVTDDEIWVSFSNTESKDQSKQWMHTHIHQTIRKGFNKRLPES
jgi:hypothetical protein